MNLGVIPENAKGRCFRTGLDLLFLGGGGPISALATTALPAVTLEATFQLKA